MKVGVVFGLFMLGQIGANFVSYDDSSSKSNQDKDYVQDEAHNDYNDALDRLISEAFNQTYEQKKPSTESVKATTDGNDDEELKCATNRQPISIDPSPLLTVNKCCRAGETFLHESISKCQVPFRRPRLPIISRELHLYDQKCYNFGRYLKHNVTTNGKCIGKHLVLNDGTLFTVIQNGSLMVSSPDQMVIYKDFCLEETGSSVLAAYICDEIVFPDPLDWVDKMVIGSALVALFITVLIYGFEKNFHTIFGMLIMAHVGLLFAALLLETALAEFQEAIYTTVVFVLVGTSYVIFASANLYSLMSSQGKYQKMDIRNVAFVAFGCCILWVISALFTLYCDEKLVTLCTVFSGLILSVFVNLIILREIVYRRHHLLTAMDSCYEISDNVEFSSYVDHRRELTILSTFAAILQLLHWILFAASRYNLLYGLSWCGLTVFAVFVCFRYRSISVLSGGSRSSSSSISKALRHHHHQQQQQHEEPVISSQEDEYNQLPPNPHSHQQKDNQKHTLTPVTEEDGLPGDDEAGTRNGVGLNEVERGA